ncbi:MAG: transporter substrate-binding domain-containing protein [Proteiniphilum sp.]|jgi:polar amino acid transport system substrate-binding protein|nr:transporter substrate-binding domain-containing protein [Proteiniphilum sp.]
MKKHVKRLKAIAIIAVSAFLLTACGANTTTQTGNDASDTAEQETAQPTKITVATTSGYKPFVYTDENDELVGYDVELVKAVFDKLPQYQLEFVLNDWDAILTGLDSGLYQMSSECIFYSDERAEKYYFSDPICYDPAVVVTAANEAALTGFDELVGKTIPGQAGDIWTISVEKYNELNPDNQIIIEYTSADFFQLFNKAAEGSYFFLTDYAMAYGMLSENNFDVNVNILDKDKVSPYLDSNYTYFLLSRYDGNEQLLSDVNAALKEVMEDGTAKAISEKYFGGKDFTPVNN